MRSFIARIVSLVMLAGAMAWLPLHANDNETNDVSTIVSSADLKQIMLPVHDALKASLSDDQIPQAWKDVITKLEEDKAITREQLEDAWNSIEKFTRAPRPEATNQLVIDPVAPIICDFSQVLQQLSILNNTMTTGFNAICSNTTPITGPATITASGTYCLKNSFNITGGTGITIDADNVRINMQGKTISGTGGGVSGIVINSTRKNIIIENGTISNMTTNGVSIKETTSNINLKNLEINSITNGFGIDIRGISGAALANDCFVSDCEIVDTATAINMLFAKQTSVKNCLIRNTTMGLLLNSGERNTIDNTTIENLACLDSRSSITVAGIMVGTTERAAVITNNTIMTSSVILGATIATSPAAYGILLTHTPQASLGNTVTSTRTSKRADAAVWSPNGRYLAVAQAANAGGAEVFIYDFDGTQLKLTATEDIGNVASFNITWSPDGRYIAVAEGSAPGRLLIYEFNETGLALRESVVTTGGSVTYEAAWSPDGRYIAIGGEGTGSGTTIFIVYSFDGTTLFQISNRGFSTLFGDGGFEARCYSVHWSPDGKLVAIGTDSNLTNNGRLHILDPFDRFTAIETFNFTNAGASLLNVRYSPDGRFIATGDSAGSVKLFKVNSGTSLTQVNNVGITGGAVVEGVEWSPNNHFLAVAQRLSSGIGATIFDFDGTATLAKKLNFSALADTKYISWHPSGQYIATSGAQDATAAHNIIVRNGLGYPNNCLVTNNKIININGAPLPSGAGFARGRGISASFGTNTIMGNTTSFCDINYETVSNVFKQFVTNVNQYNKVPSPISNISMPPL